MPDAGEVHWVPKELSLAGDPKTRPYVLAHTCEPSEEAVGTVFYASSQPTQAAFGARHLVIPPRPRPTADGAPANGLDRETYVYPGAPLPVAGDRLDRPVGRLSDAERSAMRAMLADAIGRGTGTCWSVSPEWRQAGPLYIAGRRAHSIRGTLVTFARELLHLLRGATPGEDVRFGIVVSRHDVSAHPEAYQAVVPVLPDFEPADADDLVAADETWIGDLGDGSTQALLLIAETFHVHPSALRRLAYERVISLGLMRRIEDALVARWSRDG